MLAGRLSVDFNLKVFSAVEDVFTKYDLGQVIVDAVHEAGYTVDTATVQHTGQLLVKIKYISQSNALTLALTVRKCRMRCCTLTPTCLQAPPAYLCHLFSSSSV